MRTRNSYKQILIIEDDPSLRSVLADALSAEGYTVLVAENGRQALECLATRQPHVILTDLNMPVMSGWEFIKAKQSDPRLRSIPTIVSSATVDSMDMDGVTYFIHKPFSFDELFELLAMY